MQDVPLICVTITDAVMKMVFSLLLALPLVGFQPDESTLLGPFWHGQTFTVSSSDALGSSSGSFSFSADGTSGSYETRGNIGGRVYTGKNTFDVTASSGNQLTIKYTWTSDADMASYVIGKSETIKLNADSKSITHGGKTYR